MFFAYDAPPRAHDPISDSVLSLLQKHDPAIADLIGKEAKRQATTLELIASENHVSPAVMHTMGTCLTNKYAEGYPGARYYGGCEFHDGIESIAIDRAKKMFGCKFANVQPHSGAQAKHPACSRPCSKGMRDWRREKRVNLVVVSANTGRPEADS